MWRVAIARGTVKDEYTNKNFLIAEQKRLMCKFGNSFTKSEVITSPCFSTYPPPNIHEYNRLSLNQLKAAPNIMHLGKVCVFRTISPSIKTLSLLTIVEFPEVHSEDEAVFFTVFNYQLPEGENEERSIPVFAAGTILAVLNPMFYQAYANQIYAVRCNNPADITVLSQREFDRLFPGFNWRSGEVINQELSVFTKSWPHKLGDWMSIGNYWLEKKNYIGAIQAYSLAVDHQYDVEALILRCSMNMKLKLYQKSLEDSEQILDMIPFHEKAICYRASSLIGISRYNEAIAFLDFLIARCTSANSQQKNDLMELLVKANTWRKQERDGDYDIVHMLGCSMNHYHDFADYTGSVTEMDVPGRGRGMIATENIKSGDLILGAKALEVIISKDDKDLPVCTIDMETKDSRFNPQIRLHAAIAHRLVQDPGAAESFYRLHDGLQKSPVLNRYIPLYKCINMRRIATICNYNAFSRSFSVKGEDKLICGIWPAASLFNHGGLDSNSCWKIFGNFMLVRACRDIIKGEEITISYIPVTTEYPDRVNTLSEYDFVCSCSLCSFDSKESSETQDLRKLKLKELSYYLQAGAPSCNIEAQIDEIEMQRSNNPELNVYTIDYKVTLADIYLREKEYLKASQLLRNVFQYTCKTALTNSSLTCCYGGMMCALKCGDLENAKLWANDLKDCLIQSCGMSSQALLNCVAEGVPEDVAELMAKNGIVF